MTQTNRIFDKTHNERGGMLVELLLIVALAAIIIPFLARYQKNRIERAENISVARKMDTIQEALERYINLHKDQLLAPVGKNITRVKITELAEYGVSSAIIKHYENDIQIRVLKSRDNAGAATLQGVIVLSSKDITPIRTREIINTGGNQMGFVENGKAFGAFGTWRTDTNALGLPGANGIIETTNVMRGSEQYLWRAPSENAADATMLSPLNLAGHNITNAKIFDSKNARFDEVLSSGLITADNIIFQNRTTIDSIFEAADALVSGTLSSDARSMNVSNTLGLTDTAKVSAFTTDDLWVGNLTLGGLSVSTTSNKAAILKVNQAIDMTAGYITTYSATVGFAGSITPKLIVKNLIEDSSDSKYFWDANTTTARFMDMTLAELNRMAPMITYSESGKNTISGVTFGRVATNKNATSADFMNAITEIQSRVRAKFQQLNLD